MVSQDNSYFNNTASDGGVFHVSSRCFIASVNDRYRRNVATRSGALLHGSDFGHISLSNAHIDSSNPLSTSRASLVTLIEGSFDVHSVIFGNPRYTVRSTTLDLLQLNFNMTDSHFFDFIGDGVGAIVRVVDGVQTTFSGCSFSRNAADRNGGALAFINSPNISIDKCQFMNNTAVNGGAIFSQESGVFIKNSLFIGNKAHVGECCTHLKSVIFS